MTLSLNLAQMRWLLAEQGDRSVPVPFVVLLVAWLAIILFSFGMFAPGNATVAALFVCALSFSSAIFLIVELDQPSGGLIQLPRAPMRDVLARIGK